MLRARGHASLERSDVDKHAPANNIYLFYILDISYTYDIYIHKIWDIHTYNIINDTSDISYLYIMIFIYIVAHVGE